MKKPHLLFYWERFVNRREWKPTKNSVLCKKHFEKKYIKISEKQRFHLEWKLDPMPTIQVEEVLQHPASLTPFNIRQRNKSTKRSNAEVFLWKPIPLFKTYLI